MENVNSYYCWLQVPVISAGLDQVKLKAPPTQAGGPSLPFLPIRLWELAVALGALHPIFLAKTTVAPPAQASTVLIIIISKEPLGLGYRNLWEAR